MFVVLAFGLVSTAISAQGQQIQTMKAGWISAFAGNSYASNQTTEHPARGKVVNVSSTNITIQTRQHGEITYTVDSSTKVTIQKKPAAIGDIKTGNMAVVRYNKSDSSGQPKALSIAVFDPTMRGKYLSARGIVTFINGNNIGITTTKQEAIICLVVDHTKIVIHPLTASNHTGSLSDIKVGNTVGVHYERNTNPGVLRSIHVFSEPEQGADEF